MCSFNRRTVGEYKEEAKCKVLRGRKNVRHSPPQIFEFINAGLSLSKFPFF